MQVEPKTEPRVAAPPAEPMTAADFGLIQAVSRAATPDRGRPVTLWQLPRLHCVPRRAGFSGTVTALLDLPSGETGQTRPLPLDMGIFPLFGQCIGLLSFTTAPRTFVMLVWMDAGVTTVAERAVLMCLRATGGMRPRLVVSFRDAAERKRFEQYIARPA